MSLDNNSIIVKLQFVDARTKLPKGKLYEYLMKTHDLWSSFVQIKSHFIDINKDLYYGSAKEFLKEIFSNYDFHIRNAEGYDYNQALVQINSFEPLSSINPNISYKYLNEIFFASRKNRLDEFSLGFYLDYRIHSDIETLYKNDDYLIALTKMQILSDESYCGIWGNTTNATATATAIATNPTTTNASTITTNTYADSTGIYMNSTYNPYNTYNNIYYNTSPISTIVTMKGDNTMNIKNTFIKNFEFGKCDTEKVKMSIYGPAFYNLSGDNTWVAFKDNEMIDVSQMLIDVDCFYKIPVPLNKIEIGDFIIHNKSFVKVIEKTERGSLICLDPLMGTEKTISPIKSPFGFDYFTKLVNLVGDMFNKEINDENPFGNMLPWILMSGENNSNDILMMSMLMNKNFNQKIFDDINPMMFLFLQNNKDKDNNNFIPLLMMMNTNK